MSKLLPLLLSSLLVASPVAYAQQQSSSSTAGGASGASGAAAGAAGVTVGTVAAVAVAAAVVASALATKNDPVYTTTNSGTGTRSVCIANC
jgi:membrane protease subunit (stomatin/prohibitin family)